MNRSDPCRAWLESYGEICVEVRRLQERLTALRDQATHITSVISDMPKGGSADSERVLVRIADTGSEMASRYADLLERQAEIERFIDGLDGSLTRIILRLRYVDRLSWPKIQERLEEDNIYYSERNIYVLHGRALTTARRKWAEEHKEDVNE